MSNDQRSSDTKLEANSINDMAIKAATPFDNGASAIEERASIKSVEFDNRTPTKPKTIFLWLLALLTASVLVADALSSLFSGVSFLGCEGRVSVLSFQSMLLINIAII